MFRKPSFVWRRFALLPFVLLGFLAGPAAGQAAKLQIGGTGAALGPMRVLLDAFAASHPEVKGEVLPSLGSGGGIKALLSDAIDLAVSSRPLKDKETAAGAVAIEYGTTAVVFAVPQSNPATNLSNAEVVAIYNGQQQRWADGTPLRIVLRPKSETDTRLLETYLPEIGPLWENLSKQPGIPMAFTDQQAADAIQATPGGIGPTTLALLLGEGRPLKPLSLNGIVPDSSTIADGSYPMTKSFYFVIRDEAPAVVKDFIAFALSAEGQTLLSRTGHVPAAG